MPTRRRIAATPTELDITSIPDPRGHICDIGYAQFVVPDARVVDLHVNARNTIVGRSDALDEFFLLSPTDPKASMAGLAPLLSGLPVDDPNRTAANGTYLDVMIQQERSVPLSFGRVVSMDSTAFAYHVMQLGSKAVSRMDSVYTFSTAANRGLVYIDNTAPHGVDGMIHFEDRNGRIAVGFRFRQFKSSAGSVLRELCPLIKSYHFTVDAFESRDQIRQRIDAAGIQRSPTSEPAAGP